MGLVGRGMENGLAFGRHLLVFARDEPDERALGSPETPSGFDVSKIGADHAPALAVNNLEVEYVLLWCSCGALRRYRPGRYRPGQRTLPPTPAPSTPIRLQNSAGPESLDHKPWGRYGTGPPTSGIPRPLRKGICAITLPSPAPRVFDDRVPPDLPPATLSDNARIVLAKRYLKERRSRRAHRGFGDRVLARRTGYRPRRTAGTGPRRRPSASNSAVHCLAPVAEGNDTQVVDHPNPSH